MMTAEGDEDNGTEGSPTPPPPPEIDVPQVSGWSGVSSIQTRPEFYHGRSLYPPIDDPMVINEECELPPELIQQQDENEVAGEPDVISTSINPATFPDDARIDNRDARAATTTLADEKAKMMMTRRNNPAKSEGTADEPQTPGRSDYGDDKNPPSKSKVTVIPTTTTRTQECMIRETLQMAKDLQMEKNLQMEKSLAHYSKKKQQQTNKILGDDTTYMPTRGGGDDSGCGSSAENGEPTQERSREDHPIPGAHREPGIAVFDTANRDNNNPSQTTMDEVGAHRMMEQEQQELSTADLHSTTDISHDGLAVASVVVMDNTTTPEHLPHAQDFDVEAATNAVAQQTIKWQRNFFMALTLLLIMIIVVILVLLVPERSSSLSDGNFGGDAGGAQLKPGPESQAFAVVTESPSQAPTSFEELIQSILPTETIHAIEKEQEETPQSLAYQWLLIDKQQNPSLEVDRIIQRFALATIYFATGGDRWDSNVNWLDHNVDECDWYNKPDFAMQHSWSKLYPGYLSEFFPQQEEEPPKTCNDGGMYLNLWLDNNNLEGSIPDELYLLTSLQTLSFGVNELEGSISTLVGHLSNLEGLAVMYQKNGGAISTEIGLLTKLRGLILMNNDHQGSIPEEIWQLSTLSSMITSGNPQITGTIPTEVGALKDLRLLSLMDCALTGTIPTEIGEADSLEWFIVLENAITGTIPTELGLPPKAWFFSLAENALTGTIPSELMRLTAVNLLALRENQFTGTIPTQLGQLTNLSERLDFARNQLAGRLPSELGLLTGLTRLILGENQFTGSIPSELGALSQLEWLVFLDNALRGTIPYQLADLLPKLHSLQLKNNPLLSGTIPEALCEVNGTCTSNSMNFHCHKGTGGVAFDCTDLLCGCSCSCEASQAGFTFDSNITNA